MCVYIKYLPTQCSKMIPYLIQHPRINKLYPHPKSQMIHASKTAPGPDLTSSSSYRVPCSCLAVPMHFAVPPSALIVSRVASSSPRQGEERRGEEVGYVIVTMLLARQRSTRLAGDHRDILPFSDTTPK